MFYGEWLFQQELKALDEERRIYLIEQRKKSCSKQVGLALKQFDEEVEVNGRLIIRCPHCDKILSVPVEDTKAYQKMLSFHSEHLRCKENIYGKKGCGEYFTVSVSL